MPHRKRAPDWLCYLGAAFIYIVYVIYIAVLAFPGGSSPW